MLNNFADSYLGYVKSQSLYYSDIPNCLFHIIYRTSPQIPWHRVKPKVRAKIRTKHNNHIVRNISIMQLSNLKLLL